MERSTVVRAETARDAVASVKYRHPSATNVKARSVKPDARAAGKRREWRVTWR